MYKNSECIGNFWANIGKRFEFCLQNETSYFLKTKTLDKP